MDAFNTFKRKAVTVILESKKKDYDNQISPLISGALRDPKLGNTIPILAASSPNEDAIWGQLSYAKIKSSKDLKGMVKELTAIQKGEKEPAEDIKITLQWGVKDKPGYAYRGDFVKVEDDKLHVSEKGKTHAIPFDKLSSSAVAYAKKLAGIEKAEAAKPKEEDWTNSAGKTIVATFVALKGEKITLKLANGKETTFALNLLSEDSIKKAKGYAQ